MIAEVKVLQRQNVVYVHFMCTLCACYLVDCSNGTMDNTAAVILLYRQVTGSAPYNAPLSSKIWGIKIYLFSKLN